MSRFLLIRQPFFLALPKTGTHDLVFASHTFSELPSRRVRTQLLLSMWERTRKYLVLTEHGSLGGFQLILEARRLLTKEVEGGLEPGVIVAPVRLGYGRRFSKFFSPRLCHSSCH